METNKLLKVHLQSPAGLAGPSISFDATGHIVTSGGAQLQTYTAGSEYTIKFTPNQALTSYAININGVDIATGVAFANGIASVDRVTYEWPAGQNGTAYLEKLQLEAPTVPSATVSLTFTPAVTSVSPTQSPEQGGVDITITGTGFTGATAVHVGGVAATNVVVVSDTTITCTVPAHVAGATDIIVTVAGIDGTLVSGITYAVYQGTLTVSGTAQHGSTVQVEVDGSLAATTTADGSGNWSVDVTIQGTGPHTIRARQVVAGVLRPYSNLVHITGSRGARALTVILTPSNGFTVTLSA
jgi:hypothetical protein